MSTEMPIGLSRLRGGETLFEETRPENAVQTEPRVSGWDFSARSEQSRTSQAAPVGLGRMSLVKKESVPAAMPVAAAAPQVTPIDKIDKGEAMEALLELSQVLLQEGNPARRRERWVVIRQKLENLLSQG